MTPLFGEPTVHVGLASGSGFGITLHGEYDISASEDSILYSPLSADAYAEVKGIAIGKGFHWQRNETELFHGRLQLLRHNDTTHLINILGVEQYLKSVISSEMNAEAPIEFLKAHAIISRSWLMRILTRAQSARAQSLTPTHSTHSLTQSHSTHSLTQSHSTHSLTQSHSTLSKSKSKSSCKIVTWTDNEAHSQFDVCADDHCQRYHGIGRQNKAAVEAVEATRGMVLSDNEGNIADARFSKCCGGKSELFSTCWQDLDPHYLQVIDDPYCNPEYMKEVGLEADEMQKLLNDFDIETIDYFKWQETVSKKLIQQNLNKQFNIDLGNIIGIEPLNRGKSGRIHLLKVIGEAGYIKIGKELTIRKLLSPTCLKSSAFEIVSIDNESITLQGKGWGHGVGLCQIGAAVMGATGKSYTEILAHYYPGTSIRTLF